MKALLLQMSLVFLLLCGPLALYAFDEDEEHWQAESIKIQIQHHMGNLAHEDYNIAEESIGKLQALGRRAITPLMDVIMDVEEDKHLRLNAIYALGRFGDMAKPYARIVSRVAYTRDPDFQGTVAGALGRIGDNDEKVFEALEHVLKSENEWAQKSAVMALERLDTTQSRRMLRQFYRKQRDEKRKKVIRNEVETITSPSAN